MKTITTREQLADLLGSTSNAIAHEEACLQAGRPFLPACAVMVRAGATPTPDYWQWLADQYVESTRASVDEGLISEDEAASLLGGRV